MADPISISVGALVSLCNLAWHVYKLCKDASESFKNISSEVLSLHAILREAEENLVRHSNTRVEGLTTVVAGCRDVLTDLETLVGKYKGLSSKTQRVWDRMGWHTEDIAELRLRLISNTSLLAAFMSSSQFVIEEKLDRLLKEIRNGHCEGSIISTQTVNSISPDEKEVWRAIRKELEDIGITMAAFDSNKVFIMKWFQTALERGDFQEQDSDAEIEDDESSGLRDDQGPTPKGQSSHFVSWGSTKEHSQPSTTDAGKTKENRLKAVAPRTRNRLVRNLIRVLPMYNSDLCKACGAGDLEKVKGLIAAGANVNSSASTVWPQALLDAKPEYTYFKWKGSASAAEFAMMSGHDAVVCYLVEQAAICDQRLLALAVKYGSLETVRAALASTPRFREYTQLGPALEYAFEDGQDEKVDILLPHVHNFREKAGNGFLNHLNGNYTFRPILWAASTLNIDLVKDLVTRGVSLDGNAPAKRYPNANHLPERIRSWNVPPLMITAFQLPSNSGSRQVILELVECLLKSGADPNYHTTMLQLLAYGDIEIAELLMRFGGTVPEPGLFAVARGNWPLNAETQNYVESFRF